MFSMTELVQFFSALADPTRLRLLRLMKDGEICVCFLQDVIQTNQPKISRHLAYLRKAGLVEFRRDGKWIHYSLKKQQGEKQKILSYAMAHIKKQPQIAKDVNRLQKICCRPN